MTLQSAGRLSSGPGKAAYRGVDRRGILPRLANPQTPRLAAAAMAVVLLLPLAGASILGAVPLVPPGAVAEGLADAALVAFFAAALVVLLRWRLVGDAPSVPLAAVAFIAGLLFVPAAHLAGPVPAYVTALEMTSVAVMVGASLYALALPEVWAGLRPMALIVSAVGGAMVLAIPLTLAPITAAVERGGGGFAVASGLEGAACAGVAVALLVRGLRSRQPYFAAFGAALLSVGGDCWVLAASPLAATGPWTALPALLLLAGAAQLLLLAGTDLRGALGVIVLDDLRGRRRWTAAEMELARVRGTVRGQSHDIISMLSAVDGTLLALSTQRDRLSPERSSQLIDAIRVQVQRVGSLLRDAPAAAGPYDLSELLAGIVSLYASHHHLVRSRIEPGIEVAGHPERVVRIVNNLLVNTALHAPAAGVTLTARHLSHPVGGEAAELVVADDGPGLSDAELKHALEPGWRGVSASGIRGSGLGLSQCRELAEAEGGEIILGPTHPSGAPGERGLTVRVRLPVQGPARAVQRILNSADAPRDGACPNGDGVLDRALHRPGPGRSDRSG